MEPPKYSRLVERVYGDLPRTRTFVDDTGMGHKKEESIVTDLRDLLERARAAKLKFKPRKVYIGLRQLEFLAILSQRKALAQMQAKSSR